MLRFNAIALCEACGAGFALPRPDQPTLDRFYESGAYWDASSPAQQRAHEASQAWLRVECIRKLVNKHKLAVADIGAGHGGIACALAGLGVGVGRYDFVEPDAGAAAESSASQLPFRVERATSVSELRGPFDLVFLNHVLEHVAEPLELLRQVNGLAPGGVVYVETPHADYRFKDDVFPHVFFFTPKAFGVLGERLGVRTIACETFGKLPAPKLSAVGLTQRLASRALHRVGSAPLQRVLDRIVWRYAPCDEGIWLRWIFSGMNAR
jgi:SAM-dependent methyltransferase